MPRIIKKKTLIIKTLIYRAKLLSSTRTIFYSELKNCKQTYLKNKFLNRIVD